MICVLLVQIARATLSNEMTTSPISDISDSKGTRYVDRVEEVLGIALTHEYSDFIASRDPSRRSSLGLRDQLLKAHLLSMTLNDADVAETLSNFNPAFFATTDAMIESFLNSVEGGSVLANVPTLPTGRALIVNNPLEGIPNVKDVFLTYLRNLSTTFGFLDLPGALLQRADFFFETPQKFEIDQSDDELPHGFRKIGRFSDKHFASAFEEPEFVPVGKSLIAYSPRRVVQLFDMCSGSQTMTKNWDLKLLPSHHAALLASAPDRHGGRDIIIAWGRHHYHEVLMPKRSARIFARDANSFYIVLYGLDGRVTHYVIGPDTLSLTVIHGEPSCAEQSVQTDLLVSTRKEGVFGSRVTVYEKSLTS